jgi:hypothetical protein
MCDTQSWLLIVRSQAAAARQRRAAPPAAAGARPAHARAQQLLQGAQKHV